MPAVGMLSPEQVAAAEQRFQNSGRISMVNLEVSGVVRFITNVERLMMNSFPWVSSSDSRCSLVWAACSYAYPTAENFS